MTRTLVGPARILRHGQDFTVVDRYGVVIERGKEPARLAIRVAMVYRMDVYQEKGER